MNTEQELREALDNLKNTLDAKLDSKVAKETEPLRSDLAATIKAVDILQLRFKNAPAMQQRNEPDTFKATVHDALQKHQDGLKRFIDNTSKPLQIPVETKATTLGVSYTGGTVALNTQPTGIVNSVSRLWHVRNILPTVQMDKGSLPIIKDNGTTGGFGFVSEGALKPSLDFALAESPAKAEVLAAIVSVSRQFLDDLGPQGITDWITSRLTDLYLNKEDDALLNGTGVSPQIGGMNLTGNFTPAAAASTENDVIQLVKALIQMRGLERNANAIILNPNDLGRVLLNQASGSGEFDLPGYVSTNQQGGLSIMGVPIIDTPGQTEKRFNVVDTGGMVMGIRENLNIRFFEQDVDNVQKNMITIRAEARIAFANYSAKNVIQGTFEA